MTTDIRVLVRVLVTTDIRTNATCQIDKMEANAFLPIFA